MLINYLKVKFPQKNSTVPALKKKAHLEILLGENCPDSKLTLGTFSIVPGRAGQLVFAKMNGKRFIIKSYGNIYQMFHLGIITCTYNVYY